jgi:hypothetical protein
MVSPPGNQQGCLFENTLARSAPGTPERRQQFAGAMSERLVLDQGDFRMRDDV